MASTLKVTDIQHPSSGTPAITIGSDNAVAIGGGNISPQTGMRNRIINGDMRIDQRNAGASVTVNDANNLRFPVDRIAGIGTASAGVFTLQQSTVAPAGFNNSVLATVTTTSTPSGTQFYSILQSIEGFNAADLGWGTANAQPVTLSFWVRSSVTGAFGGALRNSAANRSYPFSYTISAANTFEYKTITILGDTTGTWLTDNGVGIRLNFSLGAGADRLGTAGAWNSNNNTGASGQTNLLATNGATFYITGVQLEKGSVATPFEFRSIGTELGLCERYYYRTTYNSNFVSLGVGIVNTTTSAAQIVFPLPVTMRSAPTINYNAVTIYDGVITASVTSISTQSSSTTSGSVNFAATGGGLVVGRPGIIIHNNSSGYLDASSEL
jgi:hypothetical protein